MTQATIGRTICRDGWTSRVRPPENISEQEKFASMAAYGDSRSPSHYEYDHFVPLELGGATNDPQNLWPEPGASPNPKDSVENELNREVCEHRMPLARAQRAIATNWVKLARTKTAPPPHPPASPTPKWCSASAQYSRRYSDYDVDVHSNQPNRKVLVTGADTSASWYTDDSGYADVYFHAGPSSAGDRITVHVGGAACSTTL